MMCACGGKNKPAAEENPDVQQSAGEEQLAAFTGDLIISAEDAVALIGSDDVIFVDCTGEADKGTINVTFPFSEEIIDFSVITGRTNVSYIFAVTLFVFLDLLISIFLPSKQLHL
jgi:hypothetical protein